MLRAAGLGNAACKELKEAEAQHTKHTTKLPDPAPNTDQDMTDVAPKRSRRETSDEARSQGPGRSSPPLRSEEPAQLRAQLAELKGSR